MGLKTRLKTRKQPEGEPLLTEAEVEKAMQDKVQEKVDAHATPERLEEALAEAFAQRVDPTAADKQIEDDLVSVRAVATGWLTAVTAIVGLFGITSVVFAGNATVNLTKPTEFNFWTVRTTFILMSVGAAVTAFLAIAAGTFAAHGWPKVRWKPSNREAGSQGDPGRIWKAKYGPPEPENRRDALGKAIVGLILSVGLGALSGGFFLVAAILVWWSAP